MKREVALAVMLMARASCCFASHSHVMHWKSDQLLSTTAQGQPRPDLVIRQLVAVKGDDNRLRAHIINIGGADAGGCNLMLYYHRGGHVVRTGTNIPPIQKGKDLWIDVNNDNPIAEASSISVRVDDPDRVKESNELNNFYKVK